MRIAIVGCGAMGTVLGAYLNKNGCEVDMVDSYKDHVDTLNTNGAHIIGTVDIVVPVRAMLPEQMTGIYDLVFLFTKQNANPQILPHLLGYLDENSTVCTLQNGVPEPDVASYVGEKRTVGGTVLWGATFQEPGVSELTQDITLSDHLFEIGEIDGSIGPRIQMVADVLAQMGRPTLITDKLMSSRWGKLVNNACMSGMSAVCGCTFGEVLDNPVARACLSYIGREVKQCCEAEGYSLPTLLGSQTPLSLELKNQAQFDESQRMFLEMYEGLRAAKASMLQDLEKGLPTEVNMINGYVCKAGRRHSIPTPFNDAVVKFVSTAEWDEQPPSMDNASMMCPGGFEYALYST